LKIGDHEWHVVMGNGHSPEHACLHCPDLKLFISGDQVLPRITSNVSVYPTEPEADPLSDWLNSLARIKTRVPDDVLVLPAHNSPFVGLHARIDELIRRPRPVGGIALTTSPRDRRFPRSVQASDYLRGTGNGNGGSDGAFELSPKSRACDKDH
jgi:glyoxylase-like metal-dependent hydrolase (beta-lactamase superfamily II)